MNLPITMELKDKELTLYDFTDNPIRVMALAWEVMLGHPDAVVDGYKVLGAPVEDILKAKHKTVMEYVSFSMRMSGFRLEYLARMASCRAGFSVIFIPTADQGKHVVDVGCTLLALFTWMQSGFSVMPIEHYPFRSLLMMVMKEASPELYSILDVQMKG